MKNITFVDIVLLYVMVSACNAEAQNNRSQASTAAKTKADKIEVLDFHNTHRCHTCLAIEKATKEVLNKDFANEMKAGKITFRLINADDDANLDIVKKFGAFGSSLFLNVWNSGKDKAIDLTDFAFMTVNDEAKFKKQLKEKIHSALNKM